MSLLLPGAHIENFSRVGAFSIVHKKIKSEFFYSTYTGLKSIHNKNKIFFNQYNKINKLLLHD